MKLFQAISRDAGLITCVQFLEVPLPKILEGQKTSKFQRDFWQLSTLIANISGTGQRIEKLKSSWSTTTPPTMRKKFSELWSTIKKVLEVHSPILTHPSELFAGNYISALRGTAPSNFYTRYRLIKAFSAHPNGDGVPPPKKNIIAKKLNFGLKFSVWAPITSVQVRLSSPIFSRRRDKLWSTYKKVTALILTYPNCTYTVSWRKFIRHVVLV